MITKGVSQLSRRTETADMPLRAGVHLADTLSSTLLLVTWLVPQLVGQSLWKSAGTWTFGYD